MASLVVFDRLRRGAIDEVATLVDHVDTELFAADRVLFAGGHLGPTGAARALLPRWRSDVLSIVGPTADQLQETELVVESLGAGVVSRAVLALRRTPSAIWIAPDGSRGENRIEVPLFDTTVALGSGGPAIAFRARVETQLMRVAWSPGRRLGLLAGPVIPPPDQGESEEQFQARWGRTWASWFESCVRSEPENASVSGGLWHDGPGGLLHADR